MGSSQSVSLSTTLDPLPASLRQGLSVVASFGLLSLTSCIILFCLMTYRLLSWYRKGQIKNGANQFFILIYNLLLADIQQSVAFSLTTVYVARNKIEVGTTTCWANGWFVSVGDLASSIFILAIALHTFFAIVKGRIIRDRTFYFGLAFAWAFVYLMAIITVIHKENIYVRAGAWCWIDRRFESQRLWLHYIWIFIAMFGVIVIYAIVYLSINSQLTASASDTSERRADVANTKRAAKYMIIYPVVYVVCTLPLAGGRMAAMTGVAVPYWWFCLAGAAITSCGWLDVLLYALTRRVLIFSTSPPSKTDYGLNTFGWYHGSSFYGTTTTIEGPLTQTKNRNLAKRGGAKKLTSLRSPSWRSANKRSSDEDYFAAPTEGVITTRTTVEVSSGPLYAGSDTSILEMEDKPAVSGQYK